MFMGNELCTAGSEWDYQQLSRIWHLLNNKPNRAIQNLVNKV